MRTRLLWIMVSLISFTFSLTNIAAAEKGGGQTDIGEIRIIRAYEIGSKEWTIEDYRIDTGDLLEISVWQIEELHRDVVVRPDGRISFPLIGDVPAAGFTLNELNTRLVEELKTYIKSPQVSVIVKSFGGKKVVILGEVPSPGLIRFTEPIKILEALALAGGYDESAGLKNVLIIRGDLKNYNEVIVVNVVDILKGNLLENIYLEKNDIVFIPRSFVGNVAYFIRQISPLLGAATTYYNVKKEYYLLKQKPYHQTPSTTGEGVSVDYGDLE